MFFFSFVSYWLNLWFGFLYSFVMWPFQLVFGTRKRKVIKKTIVQQTVDESEEPQKEKRELQENRQQELQKSLLTSQLDTLKDQVQGIRTQLEDSKRQRLFFENQYHQTELDRKRLLQEIEAWKARSLSYDLSRKDYNISGRTPEEDYLWQEQEQKANNTMNTILQIDFFVTAIYLVFSLLFFHQDNGVLPRKSSYLMYAMLGMCGGLCYLYYHSLKGEPKSSAIPVVAKQLIIRMSCVIAWSQLALLFFFSEVFSSKELMLTFTVWEWLAGSGVYWGFLYNIVPTMPVSLASPEKSSPSFRSSALAASSSSSQHLVKRNLPSSQ